MMTRAPWFHCLLGMGLVSLLPLAAEEKQGMPDLAQIEQTCLPTSTANLMIWFGKHGYPKLIADGDSEDDRDLRTVHRIMKYTDARFDTGTRRDGIPEAIQKYITDAGYDCDVEMRGMGMKDKTPFTQEWLKENDEPNKGFILLLSYCRYLPISDSYYYAWGAGHAVTLVNSETDMILIHDPAHYEDETGRKILTPQALTSGTFQEAGGRVPVSGLLLLSGSLLGGPEDSEIMLTGAVCVTMHPGSPLKPRTSPASGPQDLIAGTAGTTGTAPGATPPASTPKSGSGGNTWFAWLFDLLLKK
jgi:hypothetical protein